MTCRNYEIWETTEHMIRSRMRSYFNVFTWATTTFTVSMSASKPNESIINVGSNLTNLTLLASFVFKLLGCSFIFCSSFTDLVITMIQNHVKLYICGGGRTFKSIRTALGCNKHIFCNYLGDFCPLFSFKTPGFRCEAMTQATTRPSPICTPI